MTNRVELFWATYKRLAEAGVCDEPGGGEYERVLAEWVAAGRPIDAEAFIRSRASAGPVASRDAPGTRVARPGEGSPLTPEILARLRALEAAASPGPWTRVNETDVKMDAERGDFVCEGFEATDAALIAAARNALPALLDAAERGLARLPCGHPVACVESSGGGGEGATNHCGWCADRYSDLVEIEAGALQQWRENAAAWIEPGWRCSRGCVDLHADLCLQVEIGRRLERLARADELLRRIADQGPVERFGANTPERLVEWVREVRAEAGAVLAEGGR